MKRYIYAMSVDRSRAIRKATFYADTIAYHLIKLLVYHDIRKDDTDHWIYEIADKLADVGQITIKPRGKKLKQLDYVDTTFSAFGDSEYDIISLIKEFNYLNLRGEFNYADKTSYPEIQITSELVSTIFECAYELSDTCSSMLSDSKIFTVDEYYDTVKSIISKYWR